MRRLSVACNETKQIHCDEYKNKQQRTPLASVGYSSRSLLISAVMRTRSRSFHASTKAASYRASMNTEAGVAFGEAYLRLVVNLGIKDVIVQCFQLRAQASKDILKHAGQQP